MKVPFLDLKVQYQQIKDDVLPMITEAMANGMFIGGPQVEAFEEEFAAFCDTKYCVGLNSGTDALRFALMAAGVGPGDSVITVPNTFIATTEAISQTGAQPVFVDVLPDTCNMDPSQLEAYLEDPRVPYTVNPVPRPKAVIPVHLYGQPADMDPILDLAKKHGLVVIEDACQAHGATYKEKTAGSMALAGCFSFYPGKNLGAFGEGGAMVTSDKELADRVKMIRDHGQSKKYFHDMEGYNGRLDAIQAGVLRIKLKKLAAWNNARHDNAKYYDSLLADIPEVEITPEADFATSVYHLYVIKVDDRDGLQQYLDEKGVATGLHYPMPLHLQKAYAHMGYKKGDFPVTEHVAERLLSLPMFPELTREQMDYVVDGIKAFLANK